ncbi:hypothetical protein GGQ22_15985 [Nocardioides sp. zg-579]|uniref:Phosphotransferase n=1 Tax=Nocardioides marmotae TaxID=2663857 RepID=A0A6I3JEE0_9ACTN|nr:hypothetical protein [Nocardioides marmotae]MCR6032926.1 hypothetical protein [Gordonia jinghuaiqii]MTB96576.1 hypothetical protein [Nocardioides marmotae]QKE01907.1 hypothetical protein HPC71_13145 [Nocardioides marmotae]
MTDGGAHGGAQGGAHGGEDPLVATFGSLWPGAAVTARPDGRWALVPNARRPRQVVPVSSRLAAGRTLCRFSSDSSPAQVVRRVAGAAVVGATRGALLGTRVGLSGEPVDSLARHLGELMGQPVTFSVGIGSERVNRKPVLQVFDERGRTLAFVKIGDSEVARADVTAEGANLRRVAAAPLRDVVAPRVLHESWWRDRVVLVLEPLGSLRASLPRPRRARTAPPLAAMDDLARAFAEPGTPLEDLAWWSEQRRLSLQMADLDQGRRLRVAMDRLEVLADGRAWPVGAWHGDWTPWNMAPAARGRVHLWDWERFETGVPRGLDRMHHAVNVATVRHGASPEVVVGALPAGSVTERVLAGAYLVAVTNRYLLLAATERGEHIRDRGSCVLAALEELAGLGVSDRSAGSPAGCPGRRSA